MPGRYRVPAMPPKKRGQWPPLWMSLAHSEALDHAMLMAEVGDRWCVYCGEEAQQADHLVPLPVSGPELRRFVPTVPACASCNGTLRDFHSPIVSARACHIAMHLHRRYRIRNSDDIDKWMVGPLPDNWEELSTIQMRLYHLEAGGTLRAVRDHVMPMPNLDNDAAERV